MGSQALVLLPAMSDEQGDELLQHRVDPRRVLALAHSSNTSRSISDKQSAAAVEAALLSQPSDAPKLISLAGLLWRHYRRRRLPPVPLWHPLQTRLRHYVARARRPVEWRGVAGRHPLLPTSQHA